MQTIAGPASAPNAPRLRQPSLSKHVGSTKSSPKHTLSGRNGAGRTGVRNKLGVACVLAVVLMVFAFSFWANLQ